MDYLRQVQKGLDFVEANLDRDLEPAEVSRAAGVSHWHFQRMFKALTGETVKGYVRARRLAQARLALIGSERPVLEIALEAGFESQAAFGRAFKAAFGMPPARYRSLGGSRLHLHKLKIDEDYIRNLAAGVSREPEVERLTSRHMVGLTTTFFGVDSERNNLGERLPPLWDAFMPRVEEVEAAISGVCYGVVRETGSDDARLQYTAAIEVNEAPTRLPKAMVHVEIPAATYAWFVHVGEPERIDQTVNYIYGSWFMRSGRRHTYGPDIEVYDGRWAPGSEASVMVYGVPVRPARISR